MPLRREETDDTRGRIAVELEGWPQYNLDAHIEMAYDESRQS